MIINPPIQEILRFEGDPDFNTECFKYTPLQQVIPHTNNFIQGVLRTMSEYCGEGLVDIKVHHLKAGDYPCKPAWHLDGSPIPTHPADYYICVFGKTLTEFMTTPLECERYDESKNPAKFESVVIKSGHLYHYTNRNVHRCSMCKEDETRLLIRMTNAKVKPLGRFKPVIVRQHGSSCKAI